MSLLPARSAVEQGCLSGDCRSGRPVPPLPAAEGDMGLRLAWCAALAGAFAVGCGGDPKADPGLPPSGGPPPSEVAVAIRPAAVSLLPLQTQQFSADVSNAADRSVDWSVAEGAGGSIDAMGLYVAPSNSGTFHVVATSRADRKAFAAAVVTVTSLPPQIIVNILPSHRNEPVQGGPGGELARLVHRARIHGDDHRHRLPARRLAQYLRRRDRRPLRDRRSLRSAWNAGVPDPGRVLRRSRDL